MGMGVIRLAVSMYIEFRHSYILELRIVIIHLFLVVGLEFTESPFS